MPKQTLLEPGSKYGALTIINFDPETKRTVCLCDCGSRYLGKAKDINKGIIKSCGCKYHWKISKEALLNRLLRAYINNAKMRNISFNLSKEEFNELILKPCHYCGATLSNTCILKNKHGISTELKYNGIDRIDSSKGYFIDNCVPCCIECNLWKKDKTANQMIEHAKKIVTFNLAKDSK